MSDSGKIPDLERQITAARAGARRCFQKGLGQDSNMEGKALFRFTVSPAGVVSQVYVNSIGLTAETTTCIRDFLANLEFDAPPKSQSTVSGSFSFISDR